MIEGCPKEKKCLEIKMLETADMNFIVNQEGLDIYKKNIPDFDARCKYMILPNGVNYNAFTKKYPVPISLQKKNTALYVGARDCEWALILDAAQSLPDVNFVIVCPSSLPQQVKDSMAEYPNIDFIPGIKPAEVPAYITNCDLVIVPNPKDRYKKKPWGITAKYYQAMVAKKTIVAFHDTCELEKYDVFVTYNYLDFIRDIKLAMQTGTTEYSFDFASRNWDVICKDFVKHIENL
jgi:hypothetical protein